MKLIKVLWLKFFRLIILENENKASKLEGYSVQQINRGLELFETNSISSKIKFTGPDQDEADAIISVALKYFAKSKQKWKVNKEAKKEGWIFGV